MSLVGRKGPHALVDQAPLVGVMVIVALVGVNFRGTEVGIGDNF